MKPRSEVCRPCLLLATDKKDREVLRELREHIVSDDGGWVLLDVPNVST